MTDSNTVSSSLAALGATGWAVNPGFGKLPSVSPPIQNSAVILGDSLTARSSLSTTVASGNVFGDGATTLVTTAGLAVLDGRVNCSQSGSASLDHRIFDATNVDANVFLIKSSLAGSPPSSLVITIQNQLSERGYFTWLNGIAGGKFYLVNNAGIGGEVVADMYARVSRDVLVYRPGVCFVMGGINDCAAGTAPATIMATLIAIYQLLLASGVTPVACTVTPLGTGHANFAIATPLILRLNQLIRNYCQQNNIACIDAHKSLVDPASATGAALANVLDTDLIHHSCYGARLIGIDGAAAIGSLWPTPSILTDSQADNFGTDANNWQLIDSAPWSNAGGGTAGAGVSGTVAPGWTCQRTAGSALSTAVASTPARVVGTDGDALGFNQQLVITPGAEVNTWQIFPATVRTRLVVGATYQLRIPVRISGAAASGLRGMQLQVNFAGAGGQSAAFRAWGNEATVAFANNYDDRTIQMNSLPITIPSWFTSASGGFPILQFTFPGAGAALTVNVGRATWQRLS